MRYVIGDRLRYVASEENCKGLEVEVVEETFDSKGWTYLVKVTKFPDSPYSVGRHIRYRAEHLTSLLSASVDVPETPPPFACTCEGWTLLHKGCQCGKAVTGKRWGLGA